MNNHKQAHHAQTKSTDEPVDQPTHESTKPRDDPPDIQTIRDQIKLKLPQMFQQAFDAYQDILTSHDEDDHKQNQAKHNAAKTALTHIGQLMRLGDWAALDDVKSHATRSEQFNELIVSAKRELKAQNLMLSHEFDTHDQDKENEHHESY